MTNDDWKLVIQLKKMFNIIWKHIAYQEGSESDNN